MVPALVPGDDDIHVVPLIHDLNQLGNLLGGMLQIVVHGDDKIPVYIVKAAEQRGVLAEISGLLDDLYPRISIVEPLHDLPGAVF